MARGGNSRISGITIEINGDTTKLDKALYGVNKTIDGTQTALKDVEKLLKMDPGNTELIAQKQRLLGQVVEANNEKLKTLKEASEQAAKTAGNYDAWKEKYTPIQDAINSTKETLNGLKEESKKLDEQLAEGKISKEEYEEKYRASETAAKEAKEQLKALKEQAKAVDEEFGKPMSPEKFDALQREYIETELQIKEINKSLSEFNHTAEQSNTAVGKVSEVMQKVANSASMAVDVISDISSAAIHAGKELVGMAVNAASHADDLLTFAQQTQFTTDTLQELEYASDLIDVSLDTVISSATRLKKNLTSTSSDVQEAFDRLNLGNAFRDGSLAMRDMNTLFFDVIGNLNQIQNETERDTIAMTLFGRSADQLAGLVDDGGEAFRGFAQEAHEAGYVLDEETLKKLGELNDAIYRFKMEGEIAFLKIGAALADILIPALEYGAEIIEKILQAIKNIVETFKALKGALGKDSKKQMPSVSDIMPSAATLPALASGAVVPPNRPFAAVLGDNTQEPEIVAPYSTIYQAAADAVADNRMSGGIGVRNVNATMVVDGRTFARLFIPYLDGERERMGVSLSK